MINKTGKEWYSLWQESGQNKAEFCRTHGLPYWKLANACKAMGEGFIEIKPASSPINGMDFVFKWGSVDIRLQWHFDR